MAAGNSRANTGKERSFNGHVFPNHFDDNDIQAVHIVHSFKHRKEDDRETRNLQKLKVKHGGGSKKWRNSTAKQSSNAMTIEIPKGSSDLKALDNIDLLELLINGYNPPEIPPVPSVAEFISVCSKPFEKQLTESDVRVDQNRLSLNRTEVENLILPLLREDEDIKVGIQVTTYDVDGREYPMMFTKWADKFYVLKKGWKPFFQSRQLKKHEDFITAWMFRHSQTNNLCFVLTTRRLPVFQLLRRGRSNQKQKP